MEPHHTFENPPNTPTILEMKFRRFHQKLVDSEPSLVSEFTELTSYVMSHTDRLNNLRQLPGLNTGSRHSNQDVEDPDTDLTYRDPIQIQAPMFPANLLDASGISANSSGNCRECENTKNALQGMLSDLNDSDTSDTVIEWSRYSPPQDADLIEQVRLASHRLQESLTQARMDLQERTSSWKDLSAHFGKHLLELNKLSEVGPNLRYRQMRADEDSFSQCDYCEHQARFNYSGSFHELSKIENGFARAISDLEVKLDSFNRGIDQLTAMLDFKKYEEIINYIQTWVKRLEELQDPFNQDGMEPKKTLIDLTTHSENPEDINLAIDLDSCKQQIHQQLKEAFDAVLFSANRSVKERISQVLSQKLSRALTEFEADEQIYESQKAAWERPKLTGLTKSQRHEILEMQEQNLNSQLRFLKSLQQYLAADFESCADPLTSEESSALRSHLTKKFGNGNRQFGHEESYYTQNSNFIFCT